MLTDYSPRGLRRFVLAGFMLGLTLMQAVSAATKTTAAPSVQGQPSTEDELVREALHREIYGLPGERDRLLGEALRFNPDYGPAQWQRGYLRHDRQWIDVDALTSDGDVSATMKEYLRHREKAADTLADHFWLANWCRENKLPFQEQAHLSRVLDLNPEHAAARQRLGYRQANGVWLTGDEFNALQVRRGKEEAAAEKWRSEIIDIRRDLAHENVLRQTTARDRLARLEDVYAIPLMESMLSLTSEEGALTVIETVANLAGQEPIDSLIRHAVLSASALVREAAAEKLRQKPKESYAPAMLREMYTPLLSQFGLARLPNGRLAYRHMVEREGQEERQLLILDTEYLRQRRMGGDGRETLARAFLDSVLGMGQREMAVARQNTIQRTLNQRLSEALNIATNQQLPAEPQRWWQWWDEEGDQMRYGQKQLRARQQVQQVSVQDRGVSFTSSQSSPTPQRAECFVAGTLVLTRHGTKAIESVQVGDLVLSQHVETGELAFKPVLRTTVRPLGPLTKIQVGRDEFETSGGHLYWVAGEGWVKARNLESGMDLHCLRGSLPVSISSTSRLAETYNLVVADFHTYFVGEQRVLTHDVTPKRPTSASVPGLAR